MTRDKIHFRILSVVIAFTILCLSTNIDINTCDFSINATALNSRSYVRYNYQTHQIDTTYNISDNSGTNAVSPEPDAPDSIIGSDDRYFDCSEAVVYLTNGGTGFIIGDHIIATAAHCVYDTVNGVFKNNYSINLYDNYNNVQDTIEPQRVHIPSAFKDMVDYKIAHNIQSGMVYDEGSYDYALIYVSDNLSSYPHAKLGIVLDEYIEDCGEVALSGFSASLPYPRPWNYPLEWQCRSEGYLIDDDGIYEPFNYDFDLYCLAYDLDTTSSNSGSPVFVEEIHYFGGTKYTYQTVIGINSRGYSDRNIGIRIVPPILCFYYQNSYLI